MKSSSFLFPLFLPALLLFGPGLAAAQPPGATGTSPEAADSTPPGPVPAAEPVRLGIADFERRAVEGSPILFEKRANIDKVEQKLRQLEASVLVPRFELEMLMGPAPGLRQSNDTASRILVRSGQGIALEPGVDSVRLPVLSTDREYDFGEWGPFYGIEVNAAQPLNLARYRAGRKAATHEVKVSEAEFQKERIEVSVEAQQAYYGLLYARTMLAELVQAGKDLDEAERKISDMLDEGDESVKQTDLLELRAGRYALEKARNQALHGRERASLGAHFLLQLPEKSVFSPAESALTLRAERPPSLDSLKILLIRHHPDLKRLENGLAAREELVRVALGELGPDIFLYGNFRYSKAWSSDRESGGDDPFARDPLNDISGVVGIGLRLRLNFWERFQRYRKERIDLKQLRRTEVYAAKGLLLRLAEAHSEYERSLANVTEAQKSLRAAEAWLKAAAMKADMDPTTSKDLISPYKTALFARRDYFEAVQDCNLAFARVLRAVGWTLSDYFALQTVKTP